MILRKIISGGQTGADLAGLVAGKQLGLQTGGWIPRGFRTERGFEPELRGEYGLMETGSSSYPERTELNVMLADVTVWFGTTNSAGYRCTKRAADAHEKLMIQNPSSSQLREFVELLNVQVLNVAGNRESKNPGIGERTLDTLLKAFGTQE